MIYVDQFAEQNNRGSTSLLAKFAMIAALLLLTGIVQAYASTPVKPSNKLLNLAMLADLDRDIRSLISASRIEHCSEIKSVAGRYQLECTASFEAFGVQGRDTETVKFTYLDQQWRLKF